MYFASNLKFLRKRKRKTQDDLASELEMKRSTLSGYENQVSEPSIKALVDFSRYFHVTIDFLLKEDLSKMQESQLYQMEKNYEIYINGSYLRVIATTVNNDNYDNIELVEEKAKAGYKTGFADPEFIKVLPTFQLPFLSKEKKYRTFQISGDSMNPIPNGAYVTGEYVQNWNFIKNRFAYIILTINDGIIFKIVENKIKTDNKLTLYSLNPLFEPYDINVADIKEVWKFINYITDELPEQNKPKEQLYDAVQNLKHEIDIIKSRMMQ